MDVVDDPLSEEERRAVEVHKWYLSQQAGRDVGWDYAYQDWKRSYQAEWRSEVRRQQLQSNAAQAREIRDYVWIRSEQAGMNLGSQAAEEWVSLYASRWRENRLFGKLWYRKIALIDPLIGYPDHHGHRQHQHGRGGQGRDPAAVPSRRVPPGRVPDLLIKVCRGLFSMARAIQGTQAFVVMRRHRTPPDRF